MQFTPDGYTKPLAPRPSRLAVGGVLFVVGIALGYLLSLCAGVVVSVVGILVLLNEGGQQRIRVTRSKLLMEDEYRIWGLLIGPVRSRVRFENLKDVRIEGASIVLERNDGSTETIADGAPADRLHQLKNRIEQSWKSPL